MFPSLCSAHLKFFGHVFNGAGGRRAVVLHHLLIEHNLVVGHCIDLGNRRLFPTYRGALTSARRFPSRLASHGTVPTLAAEVWYGGEGMSRGLGDGRGEFGREGIAALKLWEGEHSMETTRTRS